VLVLKLNAVLLSLLPAKEKLIGLLLNYLGSPSLLLPIGVVVVDSENIFGWLCEKRNPF
jgi:hypothetical protein